MPSGDKREKSQKQTEQLVLILVLIRLGQEEGGSLQGIKEEVLQGQDLRVVGGFLC